VELEEFAYVASHDLQEPLRKVETFSNLILTTSASALGEKSADYLDRVIRATKRMRQLLRDLLNLSRITTKTEPYKKIDLAQIAKEAADIFEFSVKETGAKIEIERMPSIEADESQTRQLLQNLIGNALKFQDGRAAHVQVKGRIVDRSQCEITVKDNGIGFDPQYADQIFKPFERLHGNQKYQGTGMGLAICRKIVLHHGGTIRAESEPGKGSTFVIRLPLK
jgi:light-regulated signal transduction histidine kinase (bacteriophytochrome)